MSGINWNPDCTTMFIVVNNKSKLNRCLHVAVGTGTHGVKEQYGHFFFSSYARLAKICCLRTRTNTTLLSLYVILKGFLVFHLKLLVVTAFWRSVPEYPIIAKQVLGKLWTMWNIIYHEHRFLYHDNKDASIVNPLYFHSYYIQLHQLPLKTDR